MALYGVFAIGYHDGGGDAYVKFNGGEVDSDLAGGIALSIATVAVILAIVLLRSGRPSARSRNFVEPV
ncbi:MAG: hypothetical protein ACRDKU_00935 [Gaiellaceae bacterium]